MPCSRHTWTRRAAAVRELDHRGWPTGSWQVEETRACSCCPAFQTRRVPGTRTTDPDEAMQRYRDLNTQPTT